MTDADRELLATIEGLNEEDSDFVWTAAKKNWDLSRRPSSKGSPATFSECFDAALYELWANQPAMVPGFGGQERAGFGWEPGR